jgi:hypothetical protein
MSSKDNKETGGEKRKTVHRGKDILFLTDFRRNIYSNLYDYGLRKAQEAGIGGSSVRR